MQNQTQLRPPEAVASVFDTTIIPPVVIRTARIIVTSFIRDVPHILMPYTGGLPQLETKRNKYELPGGKQDPKETLADAAIREVFEETSMLIQLTSEPKLLEKNSPTHKNGSPYNGMIAENFVFTAVSQVQATPRPSDEHERVEWLPLSVVIKNSKESVEYREGTFSALATAASTNSTFAQNLTHDDFRNLHLW